MSEDETQSEIETAERVTEDDLKSSHKTWQDEISDNVSFIEESQLLWHFKIVQVKIQLEGKLSNKKQCYRVRKSEMSKAKWNAGRVTEDDLKSSHKTWQDEISDNVSFIEEYQLLWRFKIVQVKIALAWDILAKES